MAKGDPDTFALDLRRLAKKTQDRMNAVVRKIVLDVGARIIIRSPVRTGRFRANWQYGEGVRPTGTLVDVDPTGNATIRKLTGQVAPEAGGKIHWLTNNLPYAVRLEYGWSKQAPAGMVGVTVVEYQKIVRDALKALGS